MVNCPKCGKDHDKLDDAYIKELTNASKRIALDLSHSYNYDEILLILATAAAGIVVNEPNNNPPLHVRAHNFMQVFISIIIDNPKRGG